MVYTFSWQCKLQKVLLSWKWFWIGNLISEKVVYIFYWNLVTIHMQSGHIQRTTFIVLLAPCDLKNGTALIWTSWKWKYVNFIYKNNMIHSFDLTNSVGWSNKSKVYYCLFKENQWTPIYLLLCLLSLLNC